MTAASTKRKRRDHSDGESDGPSHSNSGSAGKRQRIGSAFVPSATADVGPTNGKTGSAGRPNSTRPESSISTGVLRAPTPTRLPRRLNQIHAVSITPPPAVSTDVVNNNYDAWMRMAADNKINPANSWDLALIDYFADMSLLRDNVDGSINFLKASCMLQSCVKIWTSRVESVGNATNQLLRNLLGDEEEEPGATNPDALRTAGQRATARKAPRRRATLAQSAVQLRRKRLDLEMGFTVDPLFRKIRSDLDESGPGGLLLNSLSVDGQLRVAFDSADYDEAENRDAEEADPIDISDLRREFFSGMENLDELVICQSLTDLSFDKASGPPYHCTNRDDDAMALGDYEEQHMMSGSTEAANAFAEDFYPADRVNLHECALPPDNTVSPRGNDDELDPAGVMGAGTPRRSPAGSRRRIPSQQELTLAYFDSEPFRHWAGPEHWKVRRRYPRPDPRASMAKESAGAKSERMNTVFRVDFFAPARYSASQLFAPAVRGARNTLPSLVRSARLVDEEESAASRSRSRERHLLPEDICFSSNKLMTLFLKPTFLVSTCGGAARFTDTGENNCRFGAHRGTNWAAHASAEYQEHVLPAISHRALSSHPELHAADHAYNVDNADPIEGDAAGGHNSEQGTMLEAGIGRDAPLGDSEPTTWDGRGA